MELKSNYSPTWSNLSCDLNGTLRLECVLSDGNYVFKLFFSGGSRGRVEGGLQPPFGKFSNLSGYSCLSLFHTKNNIVSYNMGFSPIDHYKKTVAIPLLDSLIIQMQDRFLTKISTPTICLV